jgi:histidine triad (HIT) family protein
MSYDDSNIFAKILRNEIPCKKIYEDEFVLSFHDINPQKKIHALVIPKGKYIDLDDFSNNASKEEIVGLIKGINIVAKKLGISKDVGKGYRALSNINEHGGQEVPHLHFHLFGGEKIGKMVESTLLLKEDFLQ